MTVDATWFAEQLAAGKSYQQISLAGGLTYGAVCERARRMGHVELKWLTAEQKARIIELAGSGMQHREIARQVKCSLRSVTNVLLRAHCRVMDAWTQQELIDIIHAQLLPLPGPTVKVSGEQRRARMIQLAGVLKLSVGACIQVIRQHKLGRWVYGYDQEPTLKQDVEPGGWSPAPLT